MFRGRKTPPALIVVLALFLAACGDDDEDENPGAQFTLTFRGAGPNDPSGTPFNGTHARENIRVVVVRTDNGAVVGRADGVVGDLSADPAFSFEFPRVLAPGVAYRVDYRIDHVANGRCDPPPAVLDPNAPTDTYDHVWRRELGVVTGDLPVTVEHSTDYLLNSCGATE